MKICASHLGTFPRNPDKSRRVFFFLLINVFPLALKTNQISKHKNKTKPLLLPWLLLDPEVTPCMLASYGSLK